MRQAAAFMICAGTLLVAGAKAELPGISGTWKIDADAGGVPFAPTCVFRVTGEAIAGTCTLEGFEAPVHGTVGAVGAKWQWSFRNDLTLVFTASRRSAESMRGLVARNNFGASNSVEGEFTAKRLTAPAYPASRTRAAAAQ